MAFSLYAATVPTYLQILHSVAGLLDKAEAWCAEKGVAPTEILQARLAPDMFPFPFQIKQTAGHSFGAIDAVRKGLYAPNTDAPPESFAGLKALVTGAIDGLQKITPADLDVCVGREVKLSFRGHETPFVAEDFLLSFSQPNFFFHATTAYDLLRWKGVPIGKRDFTGKVRSKG